MLCCAVGCGFQLHCLTLFPPPCGVVVGVGFRVCTCAQLSVVRWCGVVRGGGGLWVPGLVFNPLPVLGLVGGGVVKGLGG